VTIDDGGLIYLLDRLRGITIIEQIEHRRAVKW
jgi:hypothetical protein